jgi:hypothetical protein
MLMNISHNEAIEDGRIEIPTRDNAIKILRNLPTNPPCKIKNAAQNEETAGCKASRSQES